MKQTIREKIISRFKRMDIGWWMQYLLVGLMFSLHGSTIGIHLIQGKLGSDDAWRFAVLVWVFNFHATWVTSQRKDALLKKLIKEHCALEEEKIKQGIVLERLSIALSRVDKSVLSKYGIHISKNEPL